MILRYIQELEQSVMWMVSVPSTVNLWFLVYYLRCTHFNASGLSLFPFPLFETL
jgi:hypothetical protein